MRLIDADALIDDMCEDCGAVGNGACDKDVCAYVLWVKDAPTIEAEPVIHGMWEKWHGDNRFHCTVCECYANVETDSYGYITSQFLDDFCPNCGAKMDGGEKKNE